MPGTRGLCRTVNSVGRVTKSWRTVPATSLGRWVGREKPRPRPGTQFAHQGVRGVPMASPSSEETTKTEDFYRDGVRVMARADVRFLVGGAYALLDYTGIRRQTKDFDVFLLPDDVPRALVALSEAGYRTEVTDSRWLAKAFPADGSGFIDLLFGLANGLGQVDEEWFANAVPGRALDVELALCPPEEMIWSKSFVVERHRYDGADIAHLLRACAPHMDWDRMLRRFGDAWRLLLANLVMFGFIFPSDRVLIPASVLQGLLARLESEMVSAAPTLRLCQGTLLSTEQYVMAVEQWGYSDARALGRMLPGAEIVETK